jgi:hypothetical protein
VYAKTCVHTDDEEQVIQFFGQGVQTLFEGVETNPVPQAVQTVLEEQVVHPIIAYLQATQRFKVLLR